MVVFYHSLVHHSWVLAAAAAPSLTEPGLLSGLIIQDPKPELPPCPFSSMS